ncbi:MAG: hypothetical protein GY769_25665 [bacterium]|nr:hypothetical protein [bacterium]
MAFFAGLQIAVTLLLAELAVRGLSRVHEPIRQLSFDQVPAGGYERVATLEGLLTKTRRGFKPLAVEAGFVTNSMGFRTRPYPVEKAPDSYRVVTLGDSFTFASGRVPFADHWTSLLGERFRRELRIPAEVINLGYPDIGPLFELRVWQLEGSRLSPDLVVLAFYVGNDFLDGRAPLTADTPLEAVAGVSYLVRVVRNLYRFKRAETTLAASLGNLEQADAAASEVGDGGVETFGYQFHYDSNNPSMPVGIFLGITARKMNLLHILNREQFELEFERVSRVLLGIRENVTRTGADFLLMIIPSEFQVDPEVALAGAQRRSTPLSDYDLDLPQELLTSFCEESGMACLDLLPSFRRVGQSQKLYRLRNTHWNIEGNALAVDRLVDWARAHVDPQPFAGAVFEVAPVYDLDGDGVADRDDRCPATVIPEAVPTMALRRRHFALTDEDFVFDTRRTRRRYRFTTQDTWGCSCDQILRSLQIWLLHRRDGCPLDVLQTWMGRFGHRSAG